MATDGAGGEQPSQMQALTTAVRGSVEMKCELNMDNLSKPELLTLLSIMEGELEARDLVIEALRARRNEAFIQERYGRFSPADPFLALQRDFEGGGGGARARRAVCASPMSVLEAVMAHCRRMQETMCAQLAEAESRQRKLEQENVQLQGLQQEQRKLSAQLRDERAKGKRAVSALARECQQLGARAVEEGRRRRELAARLEEEGAASGRLGEELREERERARQEQAETEERLRGLDAELEQLRARLSREEARSEELRLESEGLRRQAEELRAEREAPPPAAKAPPSAKTTASVAVGTDRATYRAAASQTPSETATGGPRKPPRSLSARASPAGVSLPKMGARGLQQSENGAASPELVQAPLHPGISPRVQAARDKFQAPAEQDQNGRTVLSPASRDVSPTNQDGLAAKQQARHTVTQVLSRFTGPPAGGGPVPGRLGQQVGLKSPTLGRIDRGNPPPIPPKKPGLSQTPSLPHPSIKSGVVGLRPPTPGVGVLPKPATPQLPPKPAVDLVARVVGCPVPALTATQVGARPPPDGGPHPAACVECSPVPVVVVNTPHVLPVSASSPRACDSYSLLAAASVTSWLPTSRQ